MPARRVLWIALVVGLVFGCGRGRMTAPTGISRQSAPPAAVPAWGSVLQPLGTIAWPWYVLIGTAITLVTGILASLTHSANVPIRAEARP